MPGSTLPARQIDQQCVTKQGVQGWQVTLAAPCMLRASVVLVAAHKRRRQRAQLIRPTPERAGEALQMP